MVSASGVSKTRFLSSDPNEICDGLEFFYQKKHGGNISNKNDEEIVAIVYKLLEYQLKI